VRGGLLARRVWSRRKSYACGDHETRKPEVVLREGRPAAVIQDIEAYREMLERLEQVEDLATRTRTA
jgi:PHD/YefM family antitoxin component YafN of YafNO toxin-antitoxin module